MRKKSKKYVEAKEKLEKGKAYGLEEAVKLGDYIHLLGKNGKYTKVKNPLKYPREKDKGYNEFLEKIKKLYV